jgi:hypothetical protein
MIAKHNHDIKSLEDWEKYGGPKKATQWKDGRSAKEVAKAWIHSFPEFPLEVIQTLKTSSCIGEITEWNAVPEARLKFDTFRGEPPNLDLFVIAQDTTGLLVMGVEAKADEEFSSILSETHRNALSRLKKNPNSKGVIRLENLLKNLLGSNLESLAELGELRYQLLTATAGILSAASKEGATRAILFIHEFRTDQTTDKLHSLNQKDLNDFIRFFSKGAYDSVQNNSVVGPLVHRSEITNNRDIQFYIGKATRDVRSSVD